MAERKKDAAQRLKPADIGHHSPSHALLALWERCEGSLRPDELLWFSNLGDSVEGGLHRVAETLDMVGTWTDAEGPERPDRGQLKAAMFALAESVRVLGSTAFVGAQAAQLLREQGVCHA